MYAFPNLPSRHALIYIPITASPTPFVPILNHLMAQSETLPGLVLNIKIFYTRMLDPASETFHKSAHAAIEVAPGRPRVSTLLDATLERVLAMQNPSGVAVAVCGPVGLAEDVKAATLTVDGYKRYAVGGLELHEEYVFVFS